MDIRLLLLALGVIGAMVAAVASRLGFPGFNKIAQIFLALVLLPVLCRFHRKLYIICKMLPRDLRLIYRAIKSELEMKVLSRKNMSVTKAFLKRVERYPNKTCFIVQDQVWSNYDVNKYANQIASVFQKAGYVKGDAVALMMPSRAEYAAIWLGLAKLGVVTALINTNLRLQSLIHCLRIAEVKSIIYVEEYTSAIDDIKDSIHGIARYKLYNKPGASEDGVHNLNELLSEASTKEPVVKEEIGYRDKLIYIYTSGTTGLPKVVIVPHSRFLLTVLPYNLMGLNSKDILYNPNPLYHTAGGMLGIGFALLKGIPTVLRSKFSVTSYWTDCIKHKCTAAQYVGEMCRYLLNAPPRPTDSAHCLRIMFGNGMRPQIWSDFVKRFKVGRITEFYGSSEGNANILNVDGQTGAVGFLPLIIPRSLHPVTIIRINSETYEPVRNAKGFCIRADINEPGMCIGLIKEGNASREFTGYLDKEASKKKIIENVFVKGDKAFLTSDILIQDEYGYVYFKDRVGDSFRWKGENVATAEVEGVLSNIAGYRDATVYGVEVPGMEGRAGMAAIVDPENLLDLKALGEGLEKALPAYARPIFLRIVKEIEMTGTYKLKKLDLQREGFDPNKIKDEMYFLAGNKYIEITPELYQEIISGSRKF
ncbi:long-chain fatty acid transport protein 4-like [Hylaeus anthracinus]|uniref:long-chain fatty acid transport protein 4-like n=1 Tax=Hylaeus anthracinus TaxID=313031 RepID=UPI0023BA2521|nr:long-chain fatty acid transport protein 4-like [Hylaeus anthracinus]XP_054014803.1 long-chain fatty acid transport protein 4-like [Hylaeus anthracinus]XP_054014804.1 long-chain fatty acid transport protein 4-like [Hylaeus anthracinus]